MTVLYFAYGSNMSKNRIEQRLSSVSFKSNGFIENYTLKFTKKGQDRSGKCHIQYSDSGSCVYGVIYSIEEKQIETLDAYEGLGYGYLKKDVIIKSLDKKKVFNAFTYIAQDEYIDKAVKPFKWYLNFVIEGAKEHVLPKEYILELEKQNYIIDQNLERRNKNGKILSTNKYSK